MISDKERAWMARWEKFRAKGKLRGVVVQGLSFLAFYLIVMTIFSSLMSFPDPFFETLTEGNWLQAAATLFIYLLASMAYGLFNWTYAEKRYKKVKDQL